MNQVKKYLTVLVFLAIFDGVWLGVIAKSLYSSYLHHLLASQITLWPAILFYLIYAAGIVFFVLSQKKQSLNDVFIRGAFLGLISYGAYDLTNQATLNNWPWQVTVIDITWGAFLTAVVSALTYKLLKSRE